LLTQLELLQRLLQLVQILPPAAVVDLARPVSDPELLYVSLRAMERRTSQDIVDFLSPYFAPPLALQRLKSNVSPAGLALVTGDAGSGKTSLLRRVVNVFRHGARYIVHTEHVECTRLVGKSLRDILDTLQAAADRAVAMAPSVLVLDDVDAICPGEEGVEGPQAFDSFVVAEHIHQLLSSLRWHSAQQHRRGVTRLEGCKLSKYSDESALQASLCGVASLVACQSQLAVHTALRSFAFDARFELPTLSPNQATFFLEYLRPLHLELPHLSDGDIQGMQFVLEGCRIADVVYFAKLCKAKYVSGEETFAVDHVIKDLKTYVASLDGKAAVLGSAVIRPSWAEVCGLETQKAAVMDTFLRPLLFKRVYGTLPVRMPRAVLLYGPPGSGATV
jgi:hypothetical protein